MPRLDLLKLVGGGGVLAGLGMHLVPLALLLISCPASAGPSTSHMLDFPMVGVLGLRLLVPLLLHVGLGLQALGLGLFLYTSI